MSEGTLNTVTMDPEELGEKAAKEFNERTGVVVTRPMKRNIVRFIKGNPPERKEMDKWAIFDGDKGKLNAFIQWLEELSKTQKVPPVPDMLLKFPKTQEAPQIRDTPKKAPAEESKTPFVMGATAFVPRTSTFVPSASVPSRPLSVFATSTSVFNASAPSFSPSKKPEVPKCGEGLYCTDILCTKRHPRTRFTDMKVPAM